MAQFMWRGRKDVKGHLVSWPVVTRPKELGGLGIADLRLGWALRVRWLWLQKKHNQTNFGHAFLSK
jgi:hypothetical protein